VIENRQNIETSTIWFANQLKAHLSNSEINCSFRDKILWHVVAVFSKDTERDSAPVFIGGLIVGPAPEAAITASNDFTRRRDRLR
jgi:hypothetical protein